MTTAFESNLGARVSASMQAQAVQEGVSFETVVARNDQRLRNVCTCAVRVRFAIVLLLSLLSTMLLPTVAVSHYLHTLIR